MKKIAICAMALAMVTLFGACKKEGVYNPSKKISKIYESEQADTYSIEKTLTEAWKWEGDLLTQIDYYYLSNTLPIVYKTVTFTYDDQNRLITTNSNSGEKIVFEYDGKALKTAYIYYFDVDDRKDVDWTTKIDFTHDGKHITKMVFSGDLELFDKKSDKNYLTELVLRPVLNTLNTVEKCMQALDKASLAKEETSLTVNLEWSGKNVSSASVVYSGFPMSVKMDFNYDNKNNPYCGFLYASIIGDGDQIFEFANKNNMTKVVSQMTLFGTAVDESVVFTYTYDGKWPVSYTYDETVEEDDDYKSESVIHRTVYYEYL